MRQQAAYEVLSVTWLLVSDSGTHLMTLHSYLWVIKADDVSPYHYDQIIIYITG